MDGKATAFAVALGLLVAGGAQALPRGVALDREPTRAGRG